MKVITTVGRVKRTAEESLIDVWREAFLASTKRDSDVTGAVLPAHTLDHPSCGRLDGLTPPCDLSLAEERIQDRSVEAGARVGTPEGSSYQSTVLQRRQWQSGLLDWVAYVGQFPRAWL
jgi:hypothetical protein